jgi:hypothetical protein
VLRGKVLCALTRGGARRRAAEALVQPVLAPTLAPMVLPVIVQMCEAMLAMGGVTADDIDEVIGALL